MVRGSATSGATRALSRRPRPRTFCRWANKGLDRDIPPRSRGPPKGGSRVPALLLAGLPRQGAGTVAFGLGLGVDRRQPLPIARLEPPDGAEEGGLDLPRDGAHLSLADAPVVYFADRSDLGRRATHERLVGAVEVVAAEAALLDGDALVLGDAHDRLARDSLEDSTRHRRRVERAVPHDEDVLAGRFAHVPLLIEEDRFVVAGHQRLALGQDAVQIVARHLCAGRVRVHVHAREGADLHADAFLEALF